MLEVKNIFITIIVNEIIFFSNIYNGVIRVCIVGDIRSFINLFCNQRKKNSSRQSSTYNKQEHHISEATIKKSYRNISIEASSIQIHNKKSL